MKACKLALTSVLALAAGVVNAETACPYLTEVPPVELDLPQSVFSLSSQLDFKFVGIQGTVQRKYVPATGMPKVTIQRYSTEPVMSFDDTTGSVVISPAECGESTGVGGESSASPMGKSALLTATAMLMSLARGNVGSVETAMAVAAAALPYANAQKTECTPFVEVVVEAPAAYMGAVETCYAEVNEPGHCPQPFPTYPTCTDPTPSCGVAIVGAGAGGLYAAMRMIDEEKVAGSDICIFEMTERVGGRLFSLRGFGPDQDLSVDAGGYRTWPRFTPTLHALITEYLEIPMDCYNEEEVPCGRFNIVDEEGKKAGFTTFVERMMERIIEAGACFYPYHELDSFKVMPSPGESFDRQGLVGDSATELHFSNGVTATASFTTILNIPQRPLLNVVRNSNLDSSILTASTLDSLHSVQTAIVSKLYLYYPKGQCFWLKLGLRAGDFEYDGDARNMLLAGRYHDGHVECDDDNDPDTCHGFLLAVYANDLSGNKAQFFRRYQRERPEPITILSNTDLEGAEFLKHAHARLEEYHLYGKDDANYTGFEALQIFQDMQPPEFAVLSTWNVAVPWAGGGWHAWTDLSQIETAMGAFAENNIFVVNEAYSLLHGWAEGSIKAADNILQDYFGVPRPWDFPVDDFNQIVAQTNSRECVEAEEEAVATGGNTGGGGGGGDDNPLCFTADALVSMADGTTKPISEVEVGDVVSTGTGLGEGIVTETLVHPVNKATPVAVVDTPFGELIGTPDHPILLDPEMDKESWIDLADAQDDVKASGERFVDVFYNLEIDGHVMEESSHSYVVNGVVASGLGDNDELNMRFPRQKIFKEAAAFISMQ